MLEAVLKEQEDQEMIEDLILGQNDFLQIFLDPSEEMASMVEEDLLTGETIDVVAMMINS